MNRSQKKIAVASLRTFSARECHGDLQGLRAPLRFALAPGYLLSRLPAQDYSISKNDQ